MTVRSSTAPPAPDAAREFERRMNWAAWSVILFLLMLLGLTAVAVYSMVARPRTASGLPGDADVQAAHALVEGRTRVAVEELRFWSALTGDAPPGIHVTPEDHRRLAAALVLLEKARRRHPLDSRTLTALAHVELALRRNAAAESNYRMALEMVPHYGEARLGLGVAMAVRALTATQPHERRRLELLALAQFAAVDRNDPAYLCALHNRAVMALQAGRRAEAERLEASYLDLDPDGPWAVRLRKMFGGNP